MTCVLSAFHVSACAPRLIKCDAVVHDNVRAFSVLVLLLRFGVTSPFWRYFSVLALLLRFGATSPFWCDFSTLARLHMHRLRGIRAFPLPPCTIGRISLRICHTFPVVRVRRGEEWERQKKKKKKYFTSEC
ncbi:hypothetical protein POVWA1_042830 [Plasmodium ovale wallikeri]|uniref:Uncharacterized protein n=1 Tax=Plasmodium ovale wallikeri TaxID=864142 RepID=A0A1A8ZAH0_PLAOA|nr:hypothetical protein POVWA1_042830 [Plasmodium ovale wallikeri]